MPPDHRRRALDRLLRVQRARLRLVLAVDAARAQAAPEPRLLRRALVCYAILQRENKAAAALLEAGRAQ